MKGRFDGGTWMRDDLEGEGIANIDGYSVNLSSDGSIVTIGAPFNDGNGMIAVM